MLKAGFYTWVEICEIYQISKVMLYQGQRKYETYEALSMAMDTYTKLYNNECYQETLNGLSPLEYRTQAV